MIDAVHLTLSLARDPSAEPELRRRFAHHTAELLASAGAGDRNQVIEAEDTVRSDPQHAFAFDTTGAATLTAAGCTWHAGRFETVSLADLGRRVRSRHQPDRAARVRFWVFDGASSLTDIASLQASSSDNTLFQVASQFNCLESPGRYITRVANYFNDRTQGPRASISAFPATLLRHYQAPASEPVRFVQETDGHQLDLLVDACGTRASVNGYFTAENLTDSDAAVRSLETNFDAIRIGLHDQAQVVLGYDWDGAVEDSAGRRITQVFASTVAGGGYGGQQRLGNNFESACRCLLRAGYLGTLLSAVSLGRTRVVLTLIGGGVFRNPIALIWDAIQWSMDQIQPLTSRDLDVILNGYNVGTRLSLDETILPSVRNRGGAYLFFNNSGLESIQL
jgi:hypothetical protein